jgi:hypothetical protein
MAKVKVKLNSAGMAELLKSKEVGAEMHRRMQSALAAAEASAPRDTGAYAASLVLIDDVTDRAVCRLASTVDHGMDVEARTGNLARALDSAR